MKNKEYYIKCIKNWDKKDIIDIKSWLDSLEDLITENEKIEDLIDFSAIPSYPIPYDRYGVFAMDRSNTCLIQSCGTEKWETINIYDLYDIIECKKA